MSKTIYSNIIEQNVELEEIVTDSEIRDIGDKGMKFKTNPEFINKLSYIIISITFGLSSMIDLAIQYYLKDVIKVQPAELPRLIAIISIPWFIKPIFGLITDLIPICGYRRKFYIILCGLLDFACLFAISFIGNSLFLFATFLFLHNCCLSFLTLLGEAIFVDLSKSSQNYGFGVNRLNVTNYNNSSKAKNNVSYFFFGKSFGSLISSIVQGLLVKYFEFSTIFRISSLIPFFFVISGCILIEDTNTNKQKERDLNNIQIYKKEKTQYNYNNDDLNNSTSNNKIRCGTKFFGFLLQKQIMIPILFIIILLSTPGYSNQMFYFYTEILHLDSVDLGIVSIITNLSTISAIAIYRFSLKKKTFRIIVTSGILMTFIFSFLAYFLVKRYNALFEIPDFPLILLYNILITISGDIMSMPLISLAAVLSPKELEGTSFSIFMSAINLGNTLADLFGSVLTSMLNISNDDLSNLSQLIFISTFIKLIPLPILFCFKKSYFDPRNEENESEIIKMCEKNEQKSKKEIEL